MITKSGKYTPDRVERIIATLRAGNTRQAACAQGGISDETFSTWCKRHVEFLEQVKAAEADAELAHVKNIVSAAESGVWTASAWWLERRRPDQWGKIDRVEIVIRERAERLAKELGCDPDDLIKEAEAILAGHS